MSKPTVIVSDLHLGAVPEAVHESFVRFVRRWLGEAETLLINGDLFDFWCEYRTVVPSAHFHTLRALTDLSESGVRLILIGGNHDAWGGPFLEKQVGIELADGPLELEIGGRRALIAHGDGLGPGDTGYKMLKFVLRSRPVCRAMRWVHPDLACGVARRVTRTPDRHEHGFERAQERAAVLETYALELLQERPDLDLIIFGHCHTPTVKRVDDGRYYINSGDWVSHRTYTLVSEARIEQKEWEEEESNIEY
jgi:UDP-2,3-diacylglucosamine hydrolase